VPLARVCADAVASVAAPLHYVFAPWRETVSVSGARSEVRQSPVA